jgi:ubiquinone/menaquinone biosynthesis C-methylase UbiE
VVGEGEARRDERRRQRALFDGVAELYDESRRGYPTEIVELMIATAGLRPGSRVLEVGCGTAQLTEALSRHDFAVTAIDLGPSMIAVARRRLARSSVAFHVVSFEHFDAPDGSFDLVVSATAFHWIDPEVKFTKAARLLRPDGWLALLVTGERYDDPFGAALLDMWVARSNDGGAWVKEHKLAEIDISDTALFGSPVERRHLERLRLPTDAVVGVENTRAIALSWDDAARRALTDELRTQLRDTPDVTLTQETALAMAQVRARP